MCAGFLQDHLASVGSVFPADIATSHSDLLILFVCKQALWGSENHCFLRMQRS
jgi:hypothetical protein